MSIERPAASLYCRPMVIEAIDVVPLSVPLVEPFVIATGRIETTRAVLVRLTLRDALGRRAVGLGEAAALPPVTREDQPELLVQLTTAASRLSGRRLADRDELAAVLDDVFAGQPVSRAGLECAVLDAWARLLDRPLCTWLAGAPPRALETDITLPIAPPDHMATLAARHRAAGFRIFKVKVGKAIDDDIAALTRIAHRVPDARFRLDANEGFTADQALRVLDVIAAGRLHLECFEQPCRRDDLAGMARLTAERRVPIVADESVHSLDDLERVHQARAATGVNLKLAKSGGLLGALAIGQRARALGMTVMCGGMVETRLGMAAMGHVACALGGVDYVDLDTAFLLDGDPFTGGYRSEGATLHILDTPGLGIERGS